MYRNAIEKLKLWKEDIERKPLILKGARQVGKTYLLKEFAKNGNTVFVTSHNIDLVSAICDKVAIVNDGKIVQEIDFKVEPFKRKDLKRIFFRVYGENL